MLPQRNVSFPQLLQVIWEVHYILSSSVTCRRTPCWGWGRTADWTEISIVEADAALCSGPAPEWWKLEEAVSSWGFVCAMYGVRRTDGSIHIIKLNVWVFRIQVLETFDIYISRQLFAWTAFLLDSLLNGPHFREKYYLLGTSPKLIQLEVCFDGSS